MTIKVEIIESDRFLGQSLFDIKEFPTEQEALDFCMEFNAKIVKDGPVPEWYMVAVIS